MMKTKEIYDKWCRDTNRNGGVLVGSSIRELLGVIDKELSPQWIKINSEADLPASGDACWFMLKDRSFYPGFYRSDGRVFICGEKKYHISVVTHYAPIAKPQPPKED